MVVFLDLNLRIDTDGKVHSCIYEKDLNLYLYIVPHSCHSKGSIKGMIWGMVLRAKSLCTVKKILALPSTMLYLPACERPS